MGPNPFDHLASVIQDACRGDGLAVLRERALSEALIAHRKSEEAAARRLVQRVEAGIALHLGVKVGVRCERRREHQERPMREAQHGAPREPFDDVDADALSHVDHVLEPELLVA